MRETGLKLSKNLPRGEDRPDLVVLQALVMQVLLRSIVGFVRNRDPSDMNLNILRCSVRFDWGFAKDHLEYKDHLGQGVYEDQLAFPFRSTFPALR